MVQTERPIGMDAVDPARKRVVRFALLACALLIAHSGAALAKETLAPHVPGELVVKVRAGEKSARVTAQSAQAVIRRILSDKTLGVSVESIDSLKTDEQLQKVRISRPQALKVVMSRLNANQEIEYAEPNYLYEITAFDRAFGLPNDAMMAQLWGMKNTGQIDKGGQSGTPGSDINVEPLWDLGITGDRRIVVAVIDTGVSWTHPDLVDNLYTNPREVPGNGIDDDGNGFVDDVHGWNFAGKNNDSSDDHDHGTHCAGTIGGTGNNGIGVAGVNWQVSLMPIKFLTAQGSGSLADAVDSINYATLMRVDVMSNSWGGGGFSQALEDSIKRARDAGILFVAAAGNSRSNNDTSPTYPANYAVENVLSVAANDNRDVLASFSCFGRRTVHVSAPGNWILSAVKSGGYDLFRGTSMAAPHVAGIAALMRSVHPEWGFGELKERLIRSSDRVASLRRRVVAQGRVNAYNAVMGIYPPSSEPDESEWQDLEMLIETPHPYENNMDLTFPIEVPGARFVRAVFDRVDTEARYDKVWFESANGEKVDELTGRVANHVTDYVEGGSARIRFTSDSSVTGWGFQVTRIQYVR